MEHDTMAVFSALTRFHERIDARASRPSTLFHYTTGQVAVGIFETGELWASHARYLNDSLELEAGIALANETLERGRGTASTPQERDIYERMSAVFASLTIEDFFITSFSAQADDLPQWRDYGKGSGG